MQASNNQEKVICQNCKASFTIEPDDFSFYEKIKVPPPTFCPECRMIRKLVFRNERSLYKGQCDLCKKNMLSMYAPESPYTVYCVDCWRGDNWDPLSYGLEYDFSKPFFEQFASLMQKVPRLGLTQSNAVDSPYANYLESVKSVYLSYSVIYDCEYIFYSRNIDSSKQLYDCYDMTGAEMCYQNISSDKNYSSAYAYFSRGVIDSYFVYDCANVSHCFLCTNIRSQEYCFKNQKYSKEEYEQIVASYQLHTKDGFERALREFDEMRANAIHRFCHSVNIVDSTGDDIRNCRNVKWGFGSTNCENSKYLHRCPGVKDSMDCGNLGRSELCYEYFSGGSNGSQNIFFSMNLMPGNDTVQYSDSCGSVSNVFGCISVKNKKFCILNKQYTEEEYKNLLPKIISHMSEMPYVDKKGIVYKYGEFFPSEFSTFAYNESTAQEYFPITPEESAANGYKWRVRDVRDYKITITQDSIPTDLNDVQDSFTNEIIACKNNGLEKTLCTTAFRILPEELNVHRKFGLSLPTECPNCRYFSRASIKNPLKLWHRQCMCDLGGHEHPSASSGQDGKCPNEFETSYSPDRPEKVYCERCYQQEVL